MGCGTGDRIPSILVALFLQVVMATDIDELLSVVHPMHGLHGFCMGTL